MLKENKILEKNGVVFFIDYNENIPYEKMAKYAILSLKKHNPHLSCAVIYCNDIFNLVKKELNNICDYLIEIQPVLDTYGKIKKIANIFQIYWATPFEETLYLDSDFLIPNKISYLFSKIIKEELVFGNNCLDFRGNIKLNQYAVNFFSKYQLPFVNNQMFLFKKGNKALEFFNLWSQVSANWDLFYSNFLKTRFEQQDIRIDISMCLKLTDNTDCIQKSFLNFVDLRPLKVNYTDKDNQDFYKHLNLWAIKKSVFKCQNIILTNPVHYKYKQFLTEEFCNKI